MAKYSKEALMEVFETPRPSETAIRRWRAGWVNGGFPVRISQILESARIVREMMNIDKLYWQILVDEEGSWLVFYRQEDATYFKLILNST
jgi:hypothetical protein